MEFMFTFAGNQNCKTLVKIFPYGFFFTLLSWSAIFFCLIFLERFSIFVHTGIVLTTIILARLFYKEWLSHILIFLALTVTFFIVSELFFRLYVFGFPGLNLNRFKATHYLTNAELDKSSRTGFKPFQSFVHLGTDIHINRDGYREVRKEEDFLPVKENEFRIVLLGASTEFGWGVSAEDAFPELLEDALNRSKIIDKNIRVLNLSLPRNKAITYLYDLLHDVPQLEPDLVLVKMELEFGLRKIVDTIKKGARPGPERSFVEVIERKWKSDSPLKGITNRYRYFIRQFFFTLLVSRDLRGKSTLWQTIRSYLYDGQPSLSTEEQYGTVDNYEEQKLYVDWFLEELRHIKLNAPVVLYTSKPTYDDQELSPRSRICDYLEEKTSLYEIPFIDTYRENIEGTPLYQHNFYQDSHPNRATHKILSGIFTREMTSILSNLNEKQAEEAPL